MRNIAVGIAKKSRSGAAWESNFRKVALNVMRLARFFLRGEWALQQRILLFLVVFGGRLCTSVVFGLVLQRFLTVGANWRFSSRMAAFFGKWPNSSAPVAFSARGFKIRFSVGF